MKLTGIFAALTTPFDATGAIAPDHMRANIGRYNRTSLAGYLVIGSTGESVFLHRAEVERVLEAVRETAAPGRILIAGTGVESTAETISRTEFAANLGYDYALIQTPQYFKPMLNPEAYIEHYFRVADASRIPVLLYSVPQFTGVALEADLVARLAEHANIAGMKDSSGNVGRLGEIMASAPENFDLLTGAAGTLYPSMVLGARGGILALANFLPELCVELLYSGSRGDDAAKARELQRRLLPASKRES